MGIKMLFKNTLKTFSNKKFQLLSIGIIICLSAFIYTTMSYAIEGLRSPMENMMKENKQESFSIDMINALTEQEIMNLKIEDSARYSILSVMDIKKVNPQLYYKVLKDRKDKFNKFYEGYNLELREFKDINFTTNGQGHKIRVFKAGKDINISLIEKGRGPEKANEIAINRVYAEKNNLNLSDNFVLNGKEYTICGFVTFPDFNMPMMGNEFIIDNSKITVGLTTDEEYENIKGAVENCYFAGIGNIDDFDNKIVKTFKDNKDLSFITNITLTENQLRSGAIYEELKSGKAATLGISMIIASIAVLIVAIITYKILKSEKSQIGVLKALGYSKYEIALPYIMLLIIVSLPMLVGGYFLGTLAAEPMKNLYLEFYLLPNVPIETDFSVVLTAIVLPLVFTVGFSSIIIMKMLSKKSIELLRSGENEKVGYVNKLVNKLLKNSKVQTRYKYSFIFRNTSKFLVFFIGISFASMLIIMSFMMSDFFDKMTIDNYKSTAYKYQGYVDFTKTLPKLNNGEEKFIDVQNAKYGGDNISIKGIEAHNKLYNVFNEKEENITSKLKEGIIVNKSFSIAKDVKKGEKIKVEINNKEYEKEVVEVSKDYGESTVYMNREELSMNLVQGKNLDNEDKVSFFTGIYSENELNKDDFLTVINKNDIMEQAGLMQKFMKISIYGMIGAAIVIAALVLYVLTTLTIEDNYYNISLLKVMGYSKKEVNNMMLNSYLVYAMCSYLINIPITILSMDIMIGYMGKTFNMVLPFEFQWFQGVLGLIIVVVIFLLGSYGAKRRIGNVALQEILKAYRE